MSRCRKRERSGHFWQSAPCLAFGDAPPTLYTAEYNRVTWSRHCAKTKWSAAPRLSTSSNVKERGSWVNTSACSCPNCQTWPFVVIPLGIVSREAGLVSVPHGRWMGTQRRDLGVDTPRDAPHGSPRASASPAQRRPQTPRTRQAPVGPGRRKRRRNAWASTIMVCT